MKKLLKSLFLRFWAFVCPNDDGKVIFYHDVGVKYSRMGTPVEMFKAHVAAARAKGYRYVKRLEELQGEKGRKTLLLCFDDGFRGVWDERAYFKKEGLCPTVFVAVGLIGTTGHLTWNEILELQSKYGFVFESHTWSHQTLSGAYLRESPKEERTDEWFRRELFESRKVLSDRLGKDVTVLCLPDGCFCDDVANRCKEAGYLRLFASYPDTRYDGCLIPRHLVQSASPKDFVCILRGALMPLKNFYLEQHRGSIAQKCESCI